MDLRQISYCWSQLDSLDSSIAVFAIIGINVGFALSDIIVHLHGDYDLEPYLELLLLHRDVSIKRH